MEKVQPTTTGAAPVASSDRSLSNFFREMLPTAPRPSLLPVMLRETLCARTLPREPEPNLVMESDNQVTAYATAGRIDGVMSAAYLFHSARISQVLQGCRTVLDLGCGPATQLAQIAEINSEIQFVGIDLSEGMLENARRYIAERHLANVTFARDDISQLDSVADNSADAVISTMVLHHLPSMTRMRACFQQINRILRPGGAIYIADFTRLKSLKSVIYFAYMNRRCVPSHIFLLDYERSLRAAFLFDQLKETQTEELPSNVVTYSTFMVPLLAVIKTPDRGLSEEQRHRFRLMRRNLPRRYRADLDDIRRFFRLGGLKQDPFSY